MAHSFPDFFKVHGWKDCFRIIIHVANEAHFQAVWNNLDRRRLKILQRYDESVLFIYSLLGYVDKSFCLVYPSDYSLNGRNINQVCLEDAKSFI